MNSNKSLSEKLDRKINQLEFDIKNFRAELEFLKTLKEESKKWVLIPLAALSDNAELKETHENP